MDDNAERRFEANQIQINIIGLDEGNNQSNELGITRSYFDQNSELFQSNYKRTKKQEGSQRRVYAKDKYKTPLDLKDILRKPLKDSKEQSLSDWQNQSFYLKQTKPSEIMSSSFYNIEQSKNRSLFSSQQARPRKSRNLSRHEQYQVLMKMENSYKQNLNFSLTNVSFYEDKKKSLSPLPKNAKAEQEARRREIEYKVEKQIRNTKSFNAKLIEQKLRSKIFQTTQKQQPRLPKDSRMIQENNLSFNQDPKQDENNSQLIRKLQNRHSNLRSSSGQNTQNPNIHLNVRFQTQQNESAAYYNPINHSQLILKNSNEKKNNPLMFLLKKYEKLPATYYVKSGNRFQQLLDDYGIDPQNTNTPTQRTWRELKEIDNQLQNSTDKSSKSKPPLKPNSLVDKYEQIVDRVDLLQNQIEKLDRLAVSTKQKIKHLGKRAKVIERKDIIGHGEDYNVSDFLRKLALIQNDD